MKMAWGWAVEVEAVFTVVVMDLVDLILLVVVVVDSSIHFILKEASLVVAILVDFIFNGPFLRVYSAILNSEVSSTVQPDYYFFTNI